MKIIKAKKKPIVLEFVKVEFNTKVQEELIEWGKGNISKAMDCGVLVHTPEGKLICNSGDYVVKGYSTKLGWHFWTVDSNYFEENYELTD